MATPINITLYRWAGQFGPFKVKIPCGECTLTLDILKDTFNHELSDVEINLQTKEWLSHWWEPLKFGAWHAPIVVVEGKLISQGEAMNRGVLIQAVINEWRKRQSLQGNIIFGKAGCPYCQKAQQALHEASISFQYFDVIKDSAALYRMIPEVKAMIGPKTPVTVPQIWLDSQYIGGYDALTQWLADSSTSQSSRV
ncbi:MULTISPECIES: glutaredoxin family protein [Vibrio]|uniref:glutaredoxin family protein n=1 Tax=Vibrio TaxID=662 RepID=UPI000C162D6D|nr:MULTISPECIES: glutaredoxin [Vibrio]NAW70081.1 glutaredoxin [Vibrio sp. V28_P6S34P95]NAX06386.1 glutaredoxin [Vibrio sp. V30_P3S12P165]NAX34630.1 glutaredoxin [Vibrio sp. V29_P1S30P107]NAX37361.1 glutaredoxin [Vibrio sp. V27_P1S3P104]NNN44963.1 glutaredoxin [Vibrio sp. 1-1(7)]